MYAENIVQRMRVLSKEYQKKNQLASQKENTSLKEGNIVRKGA